ncbi:MAG: hypothetical protein R3F34_12495 [Planctomycetota bacterium]
MTTRPLAVLGPLVGPALALLASAAPLPSAAPDGPCVAGPEVAALDLEEVVLDWPDGTPHRIYHRDEEGRKQGDFREWYENGQMRIRTSYEADELDGRYESWFENGERKLDCAYKDGVLHGRYQEYTEDGERAVTGKYDAGRKDGTFEYRRGEKKKSVASVQKWKDGELVEIDGFANPHPRAKSELAALLGGIEAMEIEPVLETKLEGAIDPDVAAQRVAALKRLMGYRGLAGLEYADMTLDEKFNWHCAAAARLLVVLGHLDHTPKKPPGVSDEEYKIAYEGTSKSNLSVGTDLPGSIDSYMDDSDPSNIDRVGHRRWCLNPAMKRTGFGIADNFSAMWSFDESRGSTSWEHVFYPSPGWYPCERIHPDAAWSVRFRGGALDKYTPGEIEVELYALDDDYVRGAPMRLDYKGLSGGQVIFRGADVVVSPGRAYEVRILAQGKRRPEELLHYYVEFTDLDVAATEE